MFLPLSLIHSPLSHFSISPWNKGDPVMLQVYSMPVGWLEFDSKLFFPNRPLGTIMTIPVPSYLLTHPKGNVVFDTGVHCQVMQDPVARLGEAMAKSFVSRTKPGEEIVAQLARFKLTPNDIKYVINSHFHFDHCGGNEFFPQSTILVQKNELETARDPQEGILRSPGLGSHIELPNCRRRTRHLR